MAFIVRDYFPNLLIFKLLFETTGRSAIRLLILALMSKKFWPTVTIK